MLYDMAITIQQTDFLNEEEGKATLRKMRKVLSVYAACGVHEKDEQLTNDLLLQVRTYRNASTDAERFDAAYNIHLAFHEFVASTLQNISRQERETNSQKPERVDISPESEIQITRWTLRGMSDGEIKRWFQKVKEISPQEVWNGLWLIAIDELGYEKVAELSHERIAAPVY